MTNETDTTFVLKPKMFSTAQVSFGERKNDEMVSGRGSQDWNL